MARPLAVLAFVFVIGTDFVQGSEDDRASPRGDVIRLVLEQRATAPLAV